MNSKSFICKETLETQNSVNFVVSAMDADGVGHLLLIWFNFNPGMDKQLHTL